MFYSTLVVKDDMVSLSSLICTLIFKFGQSPMDCSQPPGGDHNDFFSLLLGAAMSPIFFVHLNKIQIETVKLLNSHH